MTVAFKNDNKTPLVVPRAVRRRAGFKSGQELEIKASGGVITILPKLPTADDEYTPEQRRIIDARLKKSLDEVKKGSYGRPIQHSRRNDRITETRIEEVAHQKNQTSSMRSDYNNPRVVAALKGAPKIVRKAFFKQVWLLSENLHHPSLRAKKYDEAADLWQARVNKDWRFYFIIQDDTYIVLDVIPHPK